MNAIFGKEEKEKTMKKTITIALALIFALSLSTFSTGMMMDDQDGAVMNSEGSIVGYSYGGLYWDTNEYEEMLSSAETRSFVATHATALSDSSDVLSEDDALLINNVVCPLGMAIAVAVDEDGNQVTYLGGYTFVEEEGVSLGKLMNVLETWNLYESPYKDMFFSRDWTYKAVKVADGEQSIMVDAENKIITFGIVNEISVDFNTMATLRTVVNSDKV